MVLMVLRVIFMLVSFTCQDDCMTAHTGLIYSIASLLSISPCTARRAMRSQCRSPLLSKPWSNSQIFLHQCFEASGFHRRHQRRMVANRLVRVR